MRRSYDSGRSSGASGGVGFVGLLQVAFIVLKLCKAIEWSWWWVLSPMWISAAVFAVAMLVILIIAASKK